MAQPETRKALGVGGIFTLMFAATFTVMVGSLITPALPAVAKNLGFSSAPSWLVTLPSLGVVLFGPVAGWLIQRLGARKAMIGGLFLYGLFGAAAVMLEASRLGVLADRLLLGAATAVVMAAGTNLIADFFDGGARLRMIAIQGMAIEVGGVIFLALGGVLGQHGWRLPFTLYLLSWPCLFFLLLFIPEPSRQDAPSATETEQHGSLFPVFVAAFLAMTVFFVAYITLPEFLAMRFALNESRTGYFMAFISLMAVVFAGCLPFITRVIRAKGLLAFAFLLLGIGHLLFAHSAHLAGMIVGAISMGAGFGFSIPTVNHLIVEESSPAHRGQNLGYLSMAIFLGQFASSFTTLVSTGAEKTMGFTGITSLVIAAGWFAAQRFSRRAEQSVYTQEA